MATTLEENRKGGTVSCPESFLYRSLAFILKRLLISHINSEWLTGNIIYLSSYTAEVPPGDNYISVCLEINRNVIDDLRVQAGSLTVTLHTYIH